MNLLVDTATSTLYALQHSSKLGLWAGDMPSTLQQPHTKIQANVSTVASLTLASILGGAGLVSHAMPPTFVDTARIITPFRIVERKESALIGYEINQSQDSTINQYLRQHIFARDFLRDVAVIIDDIYGSKVIRNIHVVEDVDTGKPIMELTILSGLPLNDEFDQKDQLLFQRIEASGFAWGLRDVVISQG